MWASTSKRYVCESLLLFALLANSAVSTRPGHVLQSGDELETTVLSAGSAPVVIMYHSTSCRVCARAGTAFDALEQVYGTTFVFATVDVQEAMELSRKQGITALPTFQFFHRSALITQFSSADSDVVWKWADYMHQLASVQRSAKDREEASELESHDSNTEAAVLESRHSAMEPAEPESLDSSAEPAQPKSHDFHPALRDPRTEYAQPESHSSLALTVEAGLHDSHTEPAKLDLNISHMEFPPQSEQVHETQVITEPAEPEPLDASAEPAQPKSHDSQPALRDPHTEYTQPESHSSHALTVEPELHESHTEPAKLELNISHIEFPPQSEQLHETQAVEPETASQPSSCRDKRSKTSVEEVIIIGAGPSGLSAAIYIARAGLCPLILTQSCNFDLQPISSSRSCNSPAVPDRNGSELVEATWKQARSFDAELVADSVVRLEALATGQPLFAVHTSTQGTLIARSVIVASGTALQHLDVEGEALYRGRGVSWCAQCDAGLYVDQPCAVVGGGDDAFGDALTLARICSKVTLIHDMADFSARPALRQQVASNHNIDVRLGTKVMRFAGNDGHLTHLELLQNASTAAEPEMLAASAAFVAIGHVPNTDFLAGFAVLDEMGSIKTLGRSSRTLVPGIFAAGAAVSGSGALMSAVVAAGAGAAAGLDAERYLSETSIASSESFAWTAFQTLIWAGVPLLFLIWATGPQEEVSSQVGKQAAAFCPSRMSHEPANSRMSYRIS